MRVRPKIAADQAWIEQILTERWGGTTVVAHGTCFRADLLDGLVAGEREGLATYEITDARSAELVTLDASVPGRGIGTALVGALLEVLRRRGIGALRVTTTNDNLAALRFYQRRGFRLVSLRVGAIDATRRLKPAIPELGAHGIPIRDELELERPIT